MKHRCNNRGYTLVELIVVMAVFIVVIMIASDTFKTLLTQSTKLIRGEESNIEGVIGLEIFRHDIEQAGFGLATEYPTTGPPSYMESSNSPAGNPSNQLNDAPNGLPRPVLALSNYSGAGGGTGVRSPRRNDYLTIKATSISTNATAQKWTYATYSSGTVGSKPPQTWTSGNFVNGERVVVLRRPFNSSAQYTNQLAFDPLHNDIYWTNYDSTGFVSAFSPASKQETVYAYGITGSGNLCMPFNRADYFVGIPSSASSIPGVCAPNTGILYKALVNHTTGSSCTSGGGLTYIPLMDCVAAMQVVLGWDLATYDKVANQYTTVTDVNQFGDGLIDTWTNADGSNISTSVTGTAPTIDQNYMQNTIIKDANHIRTKLKVIKVYILAQNGRRDPSYKSGTTFNLFTPQVEGSTPGRTYTLTSDMLNYRWKIYRLVVHPKNLSSNQ